MRRPDHPCQSTGRRCRGHDPTPEGKSLITGSDILAQALRLLDRADLSESAASDARAALLNVHREPLEFFAIASADAELDFATACQRSAALVLLQAAANLADDMADGDCTYLKDPPREGPGTQAVLQGLGLLALIEDERIGRKLVAELLRDLICSASAQQLEIHTTRWTARQFMYAAEGFVGRPYAGFLEVLWSDTRLASRARVIGTAVGIACHLAHDIESRDRRYETLSPSDRASVLAATRERMEPLRTESLACVQGVLRSVRRVLDAVA